MTTPAPGPSGLRIGGVALLGAAVVAGLVGLATLALQPGDDTDGGGTAAPAPTSTTAGVPGTGAGPTSTQGVVPPATSDGVPVPSFPPTADGVVPGPPAAGGAGGAGGTGGGSAGDGFGGVGGQTPVVRAPVRVYNNSTIRGLAETAAQDFRDAGWQVEEVGNYAENPDGTGRIPTSTVYYRAGTSEETAARTLGSEFGLRVEPRFAGIKDASAGLIVIVTNDYQRR